MIRIAARFLVLRFLPRRILPIVTIVEALVILRSLRRRPTVEIDVPAESPAGSPPGRAARRGRRRS